MNIQEQMRWNRIPTWFCNMLGTFPNDPRPRVSVIWGPIYQPSKEYRDVVKPLLQCKPTIEESYVSPLLEEKLKTLQDMMEKPIVWAQQLGRVKRRAIVDETDLAKFFKSATPYTK